MTPQGETESTEQLKSAVNTMITDGLELQNIQVLLVARTPSRDGKSGVVKCKLSSKDAKIHILRAKKVLTRKPAFESLYIHSAQTHTERLIEINTRTLLKELPGGHAIVLLEVAEW